MAWISVFVARNRAWGEISERVGRGGAGGEGVRAEGVRWDVSGGYATNGERRMFRRGAADIYHAD